MRLLLLTQNQIFSDFQAKPIDENVPLNLASVLWVDVMNLTMAFRGRQILLFQQ
jgi:hypothetical protein